MDETLPGMALARSDAPVVSDEADDSSERPADPVDPENDGEAQLAGEDQDH